MRRFILPLVTVSLLTLACEQPTAPNTTTAPSQPTATPSPPSSPGTPAPVAPADNGYASLRPTFVVLNAVHGTQSWISLQYRFDVATDAAFANVLATGTVPEGVSQTAFTPSVDLPAVTRIFWRAQAIDTTNNLRSGFAGGTFATPFVGSARLTISTSLPCNSFMTDLLVDGTATATDAGLVFQTADVGPMSSTLTLSDGGGTATGDTWSVGQGARCFPGDYPGMKIQLQYQSGVSALDVSFAMSARISGSLAGAIKTWNVFSDGGASQQRTYTFVLVPR